METVARKNERIAPERAGILAYAIGREKKVAVAESNEIALVAYFSQIKSSGSGRVQKL